ncbi:MAG TPA: sigma-70 family RNA polymerase sigma factor [Thermoanaerobaculia bacterium]|nr:sigma-70 family RNA polymerase sigma factor [Thermoanaerobaculia bacterium]
MRFVCQRARVVGADVDDFDSSVKLALVENDYAVLRAWEGRSSLATYLTVIIQRMLADERFRTLGRWRPSSEAKRIGDAGVMIETLLHRDELSIAEVAEISKLPAADVAAIAARLPQRMRRPQLVEMHEELDAAASERADAYELHELSNRANSVIRNTIETLPVKDRMLVRLHFVRKMSIADVARILQIPQRPLYRRLEQILMLLRRALTDADIDAGSAEDLIGSASVALDFGLANGKNDAACQTNGEEQT